MQVIDDTKVYKQFKSDYVKQLAQKVPILKNQDRSSPMAFYTQAQSFLSAAEHLSEKYHKLNEVLDPVHVLYWQSIELYMKSFLKVKAYKKDSKKLGHKYLSIYDKCLELGLPENDDLGLLLDNWDFSEVLERRYRVTGATQVPKLELLSKASWFLNDTICDYIEIKQTKARRWSNSMYRVKKFHFLQAL